MRACVDLSGFSFSESRVVIARKNDDRLIELPYCPFDIMSSTIAGAAQGSRRSTIWAPSPVAQGDEQRLERISG
jgi:hypothetical protein